MGRACNRLGGARGTCLRCLAARWALGGSAHVDRRRKRWERIAFVGLRGRPSRLIGPIRSERISYKQPGEQMFSRRFYFGVRLFLCEFACGGGAAPAAAGLIGRTQTVAHSHTQRGDDGEGRRRVVVWRAASSRRRETTTKAAARAARSPRERNAKHSARAARPRVVVILHTARAQVVRATIARDCTRNARGQPQLGRRLSG
jgi:hypothetical protein